MFEVDFEKGTPLSMSATWATTDASEESKAAVPSDALESAKPSEVEEDTLLSGFFGIKL